MIDKEEGTEGGIEGGREAYEKIFTIRIGHFDYRRLEHQGPANLPQPLQGPLVKVSESRES